MSDERPPSADEHDETRAAHAPTDEAARPRPDGMPHEVEGFRILRVLGEGGMGVVYEAEQQVPRRRVALKVIRGGGHLDDLHVRLFRREAETLGRLRHPNIGAIYGAGRLPDGRPYIAMELVEGPTLDRYLASRPSASQRGELAHRLALVRRIAEAVHYAHQRGVIHRDLKPSNIVVTGTAAPTGPASGPGRLPEVKILDFGLARITDDDSNASLMSDAGTIRGTLPYMSPEQARGETTTLDVRSDVYALGVILYELVAGRRPYDVSRASLAEAVRVISEQPPRPLRDTPSGLTRVDADLQTIVLRALAKEADQRYSSAAALAEDLERFLASQPILARSPSAAYQLRKLVARHRPLVTTLAVALVAIVAAAVVSTAMFLRARTETDKARQVSAFLSDMLSGVGPSVARGRDTAMLREILDRTSERVRTELAKQPEVAAGIEQVLGRTYLQLGDLQAAQDHAGAALAVHRRVHRGPHPDVAADLTTLAETAWRRGQFLLADSLGRRALAMERALHPGPASETAGALTVLGGIQLELGRFEEAEPMLREALAMNRRLHPGDHPDLAIGFNALGNLMHYTGRFAPSDSLYRLALAMHRRLEGDLSPNVEVDLANLGQVQAEIGNFAAAESLLLAALETGRRIFPGDHPDLVVNLQGLAQVMVRRGAFARAESLGRESLAMARRINGDVSATVADALNSLASYVVDSRGAAAALPYHQEALALHRRTLPEGDPRIVNDLAGLANTYSDLGRFDEADSTFRETIPGHERLYGKEHPFTLLTLNNYARMKLESGDLKGAESLFRRVLDARRRVLGERHNQVAVSMNDLALTLMDLNRQAEAESLLARAAAVVDSLLGPDQMNSLFVHGTHGKALVELGRMAEAEPELRRSRDALGRLFGPTDGNVVWLNPALARAVAALGNDREADSLFRVSEKPGPRDARPARFAGTLRHYGEFLARRGRYRDAEARLLAAERVLRDPKGAMLLERSRTLAALAAFYEGWNAAEPSAARAHERDRWAAARDREQPGLLAAFAGGGKSRAAGR